MNNDVSANAKCGYAFKPLYDYSNYPRTVVQWGEFETYKRKIDVTFPLAFSKAPHITIECKAEDKHFTFYFEGAEKITKFTGKILDSFLKSVFRFIIRKPTKVNWVAIAIEEK